MSEATTIDRLSIEIVSNSTNAAAGIDALAASLGRLKQNGTVSVAVKNLNNLSMALRQFTMISNPAHKINALASGLQALKSVGTIGAVTKNLSQLGVAINSLQGLNLNGLDTKFASIAAAASHLSAIRPGGLSSMVNALAKIGGVTNSLSDETITRFADRVSKLNQVLTPLASKMTTIQAGFRGINTGARSASAGVQMMNTTVTATTWSLAGFIAKIYGAMIILRPLIRLFSSTISQAIEWDGVSARFGRGFGEQANEVYSWVQRLNQEMGINTQQFMQYSSVYATMLNGFGVASEDASKMALGYMELTYDIWAGYNDIYKSMDDAATAIRSAIAGEVEPIRKAGFTIIESTLEETAAYYGLEISLEKATEAQKSYLRYLTLVKQAEAQGLVGTYAKEMGTAEGLMRTFNQQLKSLGQTFGSLFLPLLVKIMPWLQAFVDLLTEAIVVVAGFFGIEIQPVTWGGDGGLGDVGDAAGDAADNLGDTADAVDATTKALKDLKKATLGIDELNVISPPTSSGSGGGSGGTDDGTGIFDGIDIDSLWDEAIFDQIQSAVDDIKEKLKDWLPIIGIIGGALAGLGIATLLKHLGEAMAQMNLLQKLFATVAIVAIEAALVFTFADNYLESGNLLYLLGEALVTATAGYLLFKAWGPGGAVLALGVSIIAQLVALEMSLADGTVSLSSSETWIQAITTAFMGAFGGAIIAKKTAFFAKEGFVIGLGVTASLVLIAIRMGAIESGEIKSDSVEAWIMEIGSVLAAGLAGKWLGAALYASGGPMGALIGVTAGLILNLVGTISVKGGDFGNEISDWINAAITSAMTAFTAVKLWKLISPFVTNALSGILPSIGTALSGALTTGWTAISGALAAIPVWGWIVAAIAALLALAIVDYDFTNIGHKIGEVIGKSIGMVVNAATTVGQWIADIGGAIWKGIKGAFEWVKENFTWENVKSLVAALFKKETWTEIIWPKVKEIGAAIWDGIWEGIWGKVKNLWGNITEFVNGFIQGFKDGFEINSPSKKMIAIGKDILAGLLQPLSLTALRDKIRDMWNKAKEWWNGTSGLEKITIAVSLVKKGWSSVKKWVGSIPAVSQAVKLAKSGWTSVKKWVGTVPAISAPIKLVKSGWSTVKKWLGSLDFKLNFKLPKIGINWATKTFAGFKISYPKGFYTYAKGGFPDMGEMFIAREAGPEMVGKIGSKTTVANNEQIVEGISEGVYAAVLAAMRQSESNGGQSVNVYLDGKKLTQSVERHQRERGASFVGRQAYGY